MRLATLIPIVGIPIGFIYMINEVLGGRCIDPLFYFASLIWQIISSSLVLYFIFR